MLQQHNRKTFKKICVRVNHAVVLLQLKPPNSIAVFSEWAENQTKVTMQILFITDIKRCCESLLVSTKP